MRIPRTPYMARLLGDQPSSLINYLNQHVEEAKKLTLYPFFFSNRNTFLYYNHRLRRSNDPVTGDPFKTGLPRFAKSDPASVWDEMSRTFTKALTDGFNAGFGQLGKLGESVRQYLTGKGFSFLDIGWLETFLEATDYLDHDIGEIVLEDWIFGATTEWVGVEGGMSRLIEAIDQLVHNPVRFSQHVTAISQETDDPKLKVTTVKGETHTYNHVINTIPLGAMQAIDMTSLELGYVKDSAIRMVHYDQSVKIGLKFKTRWWQDGPNPIVGGSSRTDLPIRVCVYPSYGVNVKGAAAVLIASYVSNVNLCNYFPHYNSDPR